MRRVLLDACVPQWLWKELGEGEVTTARFAGLDTCSDTQLLAAIEGKYDVLITLDRSIPAQQSTAGRTFAVLILRISDQTRAEFRSLVPSINDAIRTCEPGTIRLVG